MNDELDLLTGNLDQPIPVDTDNIFARIDKIVADGIETKNGWKVVEACKQLYEIARLSSISFAKFLYEIKVNWDKLNINEDVYAVLIDRLGVHRNTINRYVEAWNVIQSGRIPQEHTERIITRGIADII